MKNDQRLIQYTCPMHPEIVQDKPGMCSECGMNLVKSKTRSAEHEKGGTKPAHIRQGGGSEAGRHTGHKTESFLKKFWVSLVLSIPVILYSDLPKQLLDYKAPEFSGSQFLSFVLGSVVFFYGGWIFLASAWRELKAKMPGMMTLIALAITTAYAYSVLVTITGKGNTLFWELTTLIAVMLLGHWIEMKSVQVAQGALRELSKLLPDTAELITGEEVKKVSISELKQADMVLVRPGARIPADGEVVDGRSSVNESMVTGESAPVEKAQGNEVIAGTINGDGSLKVRVSKVGEKTFLAGVMRLVAEAQASKSKLQLLSDKAAYYLTLIAVGSGVLTFNLWIFSEAGFEFALERLVAVLVIACPHALGLAIPLVAAISTAKAANNGFLVKQRLSLEAARNINIALFDKTGTLTKGEFAVTEILPIGQTSVLQLAASLNQTSEHPIAKAIVKSAKKEGIKLLEVKEFTNVPGKGAKGTLNGQEVLIGSEVLLKDMGLNLEENIAEKIRELQKQGKTVVYVVAENRVAGAIALADMIREESKPAIANLKNMGVKVAMITGDSEEVAKWVAGELGIDTYFARVLPQDKSNIVKKLQEGDVKEFGNWKLGIGNSNRRLRVAMIGDGINDAPALTQADLGIAVGAGTNVAIESAGIILVRNDPRDIPKIFRLSKLTYNKMIQNLFWATGYNIVALPLAAGVFALQGITLQPAVAALFMSLSTVIVAVNALLLRKSRL